MGIGSIIEAFYQRMLFECRLHNTSLYPATSSVNQSHFSQSGLVRGIHVLFDY